MFQPRSSSLGNFSVGFFLHFPPFTFYRFPAETFSFIHLPSRKNGTLSAGIVLALPFPKKIALFDSTSKLLLSTIRHTMCNEFCNVATGWVASEAFSGRRNENFLCLCWQCGYKCLMITEIETLCMPWASLGSEAYKHDVHAIIYSQASL